MFDVLFRVVLDIDDRGRVEQSDQLAEGLLVTVVRGGAGQQQRVGTGGQQPRQPVAQARRTDQVVRLVDHDRVPADVLQVMAVHADVLQRVHRDDDPLEIGERVAPGRDLPLDPLDTHRVQPDQREGETRPQLVLELLEHVLRRHHEDALPPAATDQLGQDQPDLQGLAQAHHVRDQYAGA